MSSLHFIPTEWIQTDEGTHDPRIVARDKAGRTTTIPIPGAKMSIEAIHGILDLVGWHLDRVEISSILSAQGGTLFLRRWGRTRRLRIHAALAVSLAVRHGAPLWLEERLFTVENFSSVGAAGSPTPPRLVH
jgi:hypothetical protein